MNTVILDDEKWILEELKEICNDYKEINLVGSYTEPLDLIELCKRNNNIDLAIIDIEMPVMSGLELGKILRDIIPDIKIIYATGYEEHALEAYKNKAIAYILKPYDITDFQYAIDIAKQLSKSKDIIIKTFGRFDAFINGNPLVFKRAKAKELLALLVDRQGGIVTMQYAIDKLWPERSYDEVTKQKYRDAISKLRQVLKENNCEELVNFERGASYINVKAFDCDYYGLLSKDKNAILEYNGEYMFEYDWSQVTQSLIEYKLMGIEFQKILKEDLT